MGKKTVNTVDLARTQRKLVMVSWRYVVINKCIVSSPPYMENSFLGSLQMDARAQGAGGGGNFHVWLTRYVPLCMV